MVFWRDWFAGWEKKCFNTVRGGWLAGVRVIPRKLRVSLVRELEQTYTTRYQVFGTFSRSGSSIFIEPWTDDGRLKFTFTRFRTLKRFFLRAPIWAVTVRVQSPESRLSVPLPTSHQPFDGWFVWNSVRVEN